VAPGAGAQVKVAVGQDTSYLGVNVQEITAERAKALKLREEAGVEITRVESSSPADQAGVKAGDVVTEYNGQRVEGLEQFSRMVRETPAGREARLTLVRAGATQTIAVKVGARRAGGVLGSLQWTPSPVTVWIPDFPRNRMSWTSSVLGIEGEQVDGQLADYFGVRQGVLVRSVTSGSAAERAGIKAGDVITRVAGNDVKTPSDISSRLRSQSSATLVLLRERKEMTVTVMLDAGRSGRGARLQIQDRERF
jgi:serine protease Do